MATSPYYYGGNSPAFAVPKKKKVPSSAPPGMGPAADRPGYVSPGAPGYVGITPVPTSSIDTGIKTTLPTVGPTGYKLELQSDPLYAGTEEEYQSALTRGKQSLLSQIQNAILQSGYDIRGKTPADLAGYINEIDPATFSAALANPLTARAQLQQSLDRGRNDLGYGLAARGTLRSGALGVGNSLLQEDYDKQSYGQLNELLNALSGGVGAYGNLLSSADAQHRANLQAIADRLAQMQGPTYTDPNAPDNTPPSDTGLGPSGTPSNPNPAYGAQDANASYSTPGPTGLPFPIPVVPGGAYSDTPSGPRLDVISGTRPGTTQTEAQAGFNAGDFLTPGTAPPSPTYVSPPPQSTPPPQSAPPSGVQWGGQTFTTKASLSRYLQSRNENPNVWAIQHPAAWSRLA